MSYNFTIVNEGTSDLNLNSIDFNGDSSNVMISNSNIIMPGFSDEVMVTFNSGSAEAGTITIDSDDPDENLYSFALTVPPPDISVWDNNILCGEIPFDPITPHDVPLDANEMWFTFAVQNASGGNLEIDSIAFNGDTSVVSMDNSSIVEGNSEDVIINFGSGFAEPGVITIVSNDPDEDPFEFTLSVAPPANETPVASHPSDVYRWVENSTSEVISLWDYFEDSDHDDDELSFSVAGNSNGSVVNSFAIDATTGELTIDFSNSGAGITDVTVRGTDPLGAYDESTFSIYVVEVTGIQIERRLPDDTWTNVPSNQGLLEEDELRWTAQYSPSIAIDSVDWLAFPHPVTTYDYDSSAVFGTNGGGAMPAEGNPGLGHWDITPAVWFEGQFAMLQDPVEKPTHRIEEVKWKPYEHWDGEQDFFEDGNGNGDGDKIYAEFRTLSGGLHDRVGVEVKLDAPMPAGWSFPIYLKVFDPDHDSNNAVVDVGGSAANDNVAAGGGQVLGAGMSDPFPSPIPSGGDTYTDNMIITARQPGNNFIVVASGRQDSLNAITFAADGATLINPDGNEIPDRIQTKKLTVGAH